MAHFTTFKCDLCGSTSTVGDDFITVTATWAPKEELAGNNRWLKHERKQDLCTKCCTEMGIPTLKEKRADPKVVDKLTLEDLVRTVIREEVDVALDERGVGS